MCKLHVVLFFWCISVAGLQHHWPWHVLQWGFFCGRTHLLNCEITKNLGICVDVALDEQLHFILTLVTLLLIANQH